MFGPLLLKAKTALTFSMQTHEKFSSGIQVLSSNDQNCNLNLTFQINGVFSRTPGESTLEVRDCYILAEN